MSETDEAVTRKLKLIDDIATSLWGKDMRNAYDIAHAICMPIFAFIEEHTAGLSERVEPHKLDSVGSTPTPAMVKLHNKQANEIREAFKYPTPTPATDERLEHVWYGRFGDGPWVRLTKVISCQETTLDAKGVEMGTIVAKVI